MASYIFKRISTIQGTEIRRYRSNTRIFHDSGFFYLFHCLSHILFRVYRSCFFSIEFLSREILNFFFFLFTVSFYLSPLSSFPFKPRADPYHYFLSPFFCLFSFGFREKCRQNVRKRTS